MAAAESDEEDWETLADNMGHVAIECAAAVPIKILSREKTTCQLNLNNFPAAFKEKDILQLFNGLKPTINWINDTSAILNFANPPEAKRGYLMLAGHETIKAEPYYASVQISSTKPRPQTTDIVARRMIAGALGIHSKLKKSFDEKSKDMEKFQNVRKEKQQILSSEKEKQEKIIQNSNTLFDQE